jgi:hypothetical protein
MKTTTATTRPKLIDIRRNSKDEEIVLVTEIQQANINTQQEILDLKLQISKQQQVTKTALLANPFSASKLYATRKEEELLQRKLNALEEILIELF